MPIGLTVPVPIFHNGFSGIVNDPGIISPSVGVYATP
jgi:hypothetical protein